MENVKIIKRINMNIFIFLSIIILFIIFFTLIFIFLILKINKPDNKKLKKYSYEEVLKKVGGDYIFFE